MEPTKSIIRQRVRIADLKVHPQQHSLFPHRPGEDDAGLARSLQEHGLEHPIEILPDRTIVAGHRRVRAAKVAGWDEIDAVVREDLAEQGEQAVVAYLIRDNAERRQLSRLEQARCALELKKLAVAKKNRPMPDYQRTAIREHVRDWIGGTLGISGREVSRLLRVLDAGPEIQAACDAGKLSLVDAGKVAGLPPGTQERIAEAIRAGEEPRKVVARYIRPRSKTTGDVMRAYRRFLIDIQAACRSLGGKVDKVKVYRDSPDGPLTTLRMGARLLQELIQHHTTSPVLPTKNITQGLEILTQTCSTAAANESDVSGSRGTPCPTRPFAHANSAAQQSGT